MKEEREEVFDSGVLAEKRSKSTDMSSQGGPDVLGGVGGKITDAGQNLGQDRIAVNLF